MKHFSSSLFSSFEFSTSEPHAEKQLQPEFFLVLNCFYASLSLLQLSCSSNKFFLINQTNHNHYVQSYLSLAHPLKTFKPDPDQSASSASLNLSVGGSGQYLGTDTKGVETFVHRKGNQLPSGKKFLTNSLPIVEKRIQRSFNVE